MVYALGNMSLIYHSGIGYSEELCEDASSWFVNRFYPRHNLDIDIVHSGLEDEQVEGYCDVDGEFNRPRSFVIDIQSDMEDELYLKVLFHELTHMSQWIAGSLRYIDGKVHYTGDAIEDYDYNDRPHEIEARESEDMLYDFYLADRV